MLSTGTANELILDAQNKNSTTGKILLIDKNSRKYEVISLGHRNPQGLQYLKEFNIVINSEHGPKGGDEINFNQLFTDLPKNFGWPISSYGTPYDKKKKIIKNLIKIMVLKNQSRFLLRHRNK